MSRMNKIPPLFILCVQDTDGKIVRVVHGHDYDKLFLDASKLSKDVKGFWTIFNSKGRMVDGNFTPNVPKRR